MAPAIHQSVEVPHTVNIDQLFQSAIASQRKGRFQEAEAIYRRLLKFNPSHADTNHNLGILEMRDHRPQSGLSHLKAALTASPKTGQYWISYMEALLQTNQQTTALDLLDQAEKSELDRVALDHLALRFENFKQLLGQKTEATGTDAQTKSAQGGLIAAPVATPTQQQIDALVALFNRQRYTDVIEHAKTLVSSFPDSAFGWKILGAALAQLGRNQDALEPMQQAASLSPNDQEAYCNLGVTLNALGKRVEAIESYRRALQINPVFAQAHNNLGVAQMDLGFLNEAETSFRKAIRNKRDYAEACNNLGNLLTGQKRLTEAEDIFRCAISIDPNYVRAIKNLGAVLREQSRFAESEAILRQAIQIRPDYADAYNLLGLTLKELQKFDESESCFRKALVISPDFVEALVNLGLLLKVDARLDEAITCFLNAIEIRPDSIEAHECLGVTLKELGRREEAEATFQMALELNPKAVEPMIGLAEILNDMGKFKEAEMLYYRVLKLKPEMPEAWAHLTRSRKMTLDDMSWLTTAERISSQVSNGYVESQLRFAMGKFCDDTRRYDQAFGYFQRANELKKRYGRPYDRANEEAATQQFISAYSTEIVAQLHQGSSPSDKPMFIVGMPRSGTSLIEQIIASHPEAFGAGELRYWPDVSRKYQRQVLLADFSEEMLSSIAHDCLQLLDNYSHDAQRVVDKLPGNVKFLGLIHATFPSAKIIHAQRNPIDTCLSIYFQNFNSGHNYSHDLQDLVHYYYQYHSRMMHWRGVLPPGVLLDVPYESLVEGTESWSRKIIDFIGLNWDDNCLGFHQTERKVGTASNWQVRQPIYKGSKERWRNYEKFVGRLLPLLDLYDPLQ